jgi:4-hydroxymandelate oxidase
LSPSNLTVDDIGWLRAVNVSNDGERQLNDGIATVDALAEVVDSVGDDAQVYVDGGMRRGADVVRALCIGARVVLVGRLVL